MTKKFKKSGKIIPVTFFIVSIILLQSSYCFAVSYDMQSILKTYIKKNFPWAEIEISELSVSEPIFAMPERILIEKGPPGKTVFILHFENGKKVNATAYIKAYDWIVMSSKAMRKGHHLLQTDIFSTLMDITKIPRGAINRIDNAAGMQLTRSVNANVPLVDIMVKDRTVVKKGQMVFLVIESPKFTIRTTGEIRANAFVGSQAKVINLASKRVISGVLIDENTVKIEF